MRLKRWENVSFVGMVRMWRRALRGHVKLNLMTSATLTQIEIYYFVYKFDSICCTT